MIKSAKTAVLFINLLILILFLTSCSDQPRQVKNKYSLFILAKNGKNYMLETNSLASGKLIPEATGVSLEKVELDRDIIVKEGFYYSKDWKKPLFTKYKITNGVIEKVASVAAADFSLENFYWLTGDTLLLIGNNDSDFKKIKYILVKTEQMTILDSGDLNIPKPPGKYTSIANGIVEMRKDRLFIGYTYHQQLSSSNYTTSDTTYMAEFSYPEMHLLHIDKDTRSTYPGGLNTVQNYSFNDEQYNFYFMTCPGIALGNRPDRPTGIYRIKAGDMAIDKEYFFNLSAPIKNHSYGMWYLGGGKALVRSERKDLYKGLNDHYSTAHFEFYLIDLKGKVVQKLNLPLDKGTRRACVIVEGNTAYIAINSSTAGNFIWLYNYKTGSLKKGLELGGSTDFIMRIDQLNHF